MREHAAASPHLLRRIAAAAAGARASVARRLGDVPLPGWTRPLAIASLALLVVQSFDHRYVRGNLAWTMLVTGALAVLLGALYVALGRDDQRVVPARQRPFTMGLLLILAANTMIHSGLVVPHLTDKNRYTVDAAVATDCATQQFLHARDPYTNVHMLTCLWNHGLQFYQTTPKRAGKFAPFSTFPTAYHTESGVGTAHWDWLLWATYQNDLLRERLNPHYVPAEFETRFNYPGGAILFGVVSWIFGLRDLVLLYLTCAFVASYLIFRCAHPRIRLATGLILLGDTPLLLDSVVGATDVLYAMLLVIYWQLRERPIVGGLILGLAAATRQQVWFFLPFLLYLGWRTRGRRDLWQRGLPALAVFLACNVPFVVENPHDWLAGVLGPMADPLFAQGVGLIALSIALFQQHIGSQFFYSILELLALAGLFRFYTRYWMLAPGLAMLLPLAPLALAWRSLHTYFLVLPLLATAVLAAPASGAAAATGEAPERAVDAAA